jgi:hypothetical protein
MKNWIYVSMSLMTSLAAGGAQSISQAPIEQGQRGPANLLSDEEIAKCLQRLDLAQAPTLPDGSPCMSTIA